jgi:apolipoprotein N-acyltransferase
MTTALILKILSKAGSAIAQNWKAILFALALGALLWIVADWRAQAAEIDALSYEAEAAKVQARIWRDTSRLQTERALEAALLREATEARLAELLAQPPEVITIIEEAAGSVADAIPDDAPCEEAVRSLAEFLQGVPE